MMNELSDRYPSAWPLILLLVALYASGILAELPCMAYPEPVFFNSRISYDNLFSSGTLSMILAGVTLAFDAVVLAMIETCVTSYRSTFLPFIFLCGTVCNPYALYFSPLHPAALFLTLHLYYCIKYGKHDTRTDDSDIGFANCFLSLSILAWPPAVWLAPFSLAFNMKDSQNRASYSAASISGLLTPLMAVAIIEYLIDGTDATLNFFKRLWIRCIDIPEHTLSLPLTRIVMIIIIIIAAVAILTNIARNFRRYGLSRYQALKIIMLYTGPTLLLSLIFKPFSSAPTGLIMFIPLSVLANDSLHNSYSKRFTRMLIAAAIIIAAAERIALFN